MVQNSECLAEWEDQEAGGSGTGRGGKVEILSVFVIPTFNSSVIGAAQHCLSFQALHAGAR